MALNIRQIRDRDYFFGRGKYANKANNCLCYDSIHSDDEIILRTDHVVSIINKDNKVQYMLLVANNKAIYLDYLRQVRKATVFIEGVAHRTWLVKLFRNRFKPYYCKKFEGHDFVCEVTFDGLYEEARIQNFSKQKVRIN